MSKQEQPIEELIQETADLILENVDYDIYKEDLEERNILFGIEEHLCTLLSKVKNYDIDEIMAWEVYYD